VLSGGNIVVVDVRRDNEAGRGDIEFPRRYSNKVGCGQSRVSRGYGGDTVPGM
jgi:hypothetical protein